MNGSLPEKSEPLLSTRYEPLALEAKMPKAQLSRALKKERFSHRKALLFSVLLENLANHFRLASIFPMKKNNTHYQTGMEATILFIFTTTAVK